VSDGDTITAFTSNQTKVRLRLLGIDAPEVPHGDKPGQPFGEEAQDYLDHLIGARPFGWTPTGRTSTNGRWPSCGTSKSTSDGGNGLRRGVSGSTMSGVLPGAKGRRGKGPARSGGHGGTRAELRYSAAVPAEDADLGGLIMAITRIIDLKIKQDLFPN
jgi:hypothetical protein